MYAFEFTVGIGIGVGAGIALGVLVGVFFTEKVYEEKESYCNEVWDKGKCQAYQERKSSLTLYELSWFYEKCKATNVESRPHTH